MRWLAFVLAVLALPLGAAGCGDEDDDSSGDNAEGATLPTGDVRVAQISGLAGLATNAFASAGAQGLYDYVALQVTRRCTAEQLAAAMADQELPSGFLGVENVSFKGDGAHAIVKLKFDGDEREAEWVLVPEPGATWRILNMPGLEECTS